MKIKLAKTAGFCMGVKRAMDIVSNSIHGTEDGMLYTYGPLIHNPQVIKMLEANRVKTINDISYINKGTIVIRTHGITPAKRKEIEDRGLTINDATCPLVMKVQSIIRRYASQGYFTIIVGDKGHAEVEALTGFAQDGRCIVINSIEEIKNIPDNEKICVVAQTTLNTENYRLITERIKERFPLAIIADTICGATEKRQLEVLRLAPEVDAMIVVGGKNSANTSRLASISHSTGAPTFMVETEKELDSKELAKFNTIGITAGASTPHWIIKRVIEKVMNIRNEQRGILLNLLFKFSEYIINSKIYIALCAGLMTYTSCSLQGIKYDLRYFFISFFYFLSTYLLNNMTNINSIKITKPRAITFLDENDQSTLPSYIPYYILVCTLITLTIAYSLGQTVFTIILISFILRFMYDFPLIPKGVALYLGFERLKDIPASKDIFVSIAWGTITTLIPFFSTNNQIAVSSTIVAFCFFFFITYIRSILFDIKEIQSDKLVGKETIPTLIGKENSKIFLVVISFLLLIGLYLSYILQLTTSLGIFLILSVCYTWLYLWLYHKRIISFGRSCDLIVDSNFIFIGLITLYWATFWK